MQAICNTGVPERRRVSSRADHVQAAADELSQIMARIAPLVEGGRRDEIGFLQVRQHQLRTWLAEAFGRRRGWQLTDEHSWRKLSKRTFRRLDDYSYRPPNVFDHPYYYMGADGLPAGIVVHVYGSDIERTRQAVRAFCEWQGLEAYRSGFPSWWYPGRTRLVIYTPAVRSQGLAA